jgi:hypothetical protein
MKRKIECFIVVILALLTATASVAAENYPPKVGSTLPDMELLKPVDSTHIKYLGLPESGNSFKVN